MNLLIILVSSLMFCFYLMQTFRLLRMH